MHPLAWSSSCQRAENSLGTGSPWFLLAGEQSLAAPLLLHPWAGSSAGGTLSMHVCYPSHLNYCKNERTKAGEYVRALVAVAKATNFKPDKHMLITAAILLPAGILNGRKQTQKGSEKWDEPPMALESKQLCRQESCAAVAEYFSPSLLLVHTPVAGSWLSVVLCCSKMCNQSAEP